MHTADEPPPFGRNANLSVLYVHRNHRRQGLGSALLRYALALAESEHCDNFSVAHAEATDFYAKHGLRAAARWARFRLSAQTDKAQYTTEPLPDAPYDLVRGFSLAIGRYQNAHHDWERTRPGATPDFAEWRHLKVERVWITTGRHRAALILEESPRAPRTAETFLFTASAASAPELIAAVRDLAARSGFDHLYFFAPADFKHKDAAPTEYSQNLFLKKL
ncbi:MAG: GNAT family N-acetyltransferase [Chloroflexota bacterium]